MNVADRNYLSRFAMDSSMEYGQDGLYGFEFSYDSPSGHFDDENLLDAEDIMLEDDLLFED